MDDLISIPFLGEVSIDFDSESKVFCLKIPIFSSKNMSKCVIDYVLARQNHFFKPYKTYFILEDSTTVYLLQEIPFIWGFQPSFREQIYAMRKLGVKMHQMLLEMAIEEKLKIVEDFLLDDIFQDG